MTHDPTRDCEHGRLKGKCDVCDLQAEVDRLTELLNNPEEHYPGNFDTPQRANALLTGLCQDAATEIAKLQAEVLEQCRINGMSAEREDALRAEIKRLKAAQPAPVHGYAHWEGRIKELMKQAGMPDSVSIAAAMKQLVNEMMQPAAQGVPETDFGNMAQPTAWIGLTVYEIGVCSTEAAMNRSEMVGGAVTFARAIEAKLKEKNHG